MKQVKLEIRETLRYSREVIVLVPDDMNEEVLEKALQDGDREWGGVDEFVHALKKHGITNTDGWDSDLESPDDVESECIDYEIIED